MAEKKGRSENSVLGLDPGLDLDLGAVQGWCTQQKTIVSVFCGDY